MMPRVDPELHEFEVLERLIAEGRYSAEEILESLAALAELQRWDDLWSIADRIGREVSVLFDSEMRIWVDVGTAEAGRVELEAPIGSTIPFRMWIHTHPKNAYWSETMILQHYRPTARKNRRCPAQRKATKAGNGYRNMRVRF